MVDETKNNITERAISSFIWNFSGTGFHSFLQVVVLAVLARLLTPEDFGLVSAALVVISFSKMFSELGIGPAIVQTTKLEKRHLETGFSVSILLGLIFSIAIIMFADLIAGFFRMEDLVTILYVLSPLFILRGISIVPIALLQRELSFKLITIFEVVSFALGYGALGIILAFLGFGPWALVIGNLGQLVIKVILLILYKPHPRSLFFHFGTLRELLSFGVGHTIGGFSGHLALQGDRLIVGRLLGAEALGFYGRAYQLSTKPMSLFAKIIEKILFPTLSLVKENKEKLVRGFKRSFALMSLIVVPASLFLFVLAPEIVLVILGPGWEQIALPFQILILGTIFRAGYKLNDAVAMAVGAVYKKAKLKILYAIMVVAGAWIGSSWDLPGVAVGVFSALFVHYLLMTILSLNYIQINVVSFLKMQIPSILGGLIVLGSSQGIALYLRAQNLHPFLTIAISAFFSGLLLFALMLIFPGFLLKEEGIWILKIAGGKLSKVPFLKKMAKIIETRF